MDISHFTMVGFALDTHDQAAFTQTAIGYSADCEAKRISDTDIICLIRDGSGAELRIATRRNNAGRAEIVDIDPAFSGEGRTSVEVTGDVSDPIEKPFEYIISAKFSGEQTPIIFAITDPLESAAFKPGAHIQIDVAAFSFQPAVFGDETAYIRSQSGQTKFAPNFFIPTGMFFEKVGGAMPNDAPRPVAYADFAGKVLKAELKTNVSGKGKFWWALVRTYAGATVDVVIDPSSIAQAPVPGSIIAGRFWLTARLSPGP